MVNKKSGVLWRVFLLLLILIPITFRVYDIYYINSTWRINSKIVKRGKIYRDYIKEKTKLGIPEVYYRYSFLTPEEMMTLDVLSNQDGYNIKEILNDIDKYVLSKDNKKPYEELSYYEKTEVSYYIESVNKQVNESLEKNSSYIYSMKMLMSVFTSLMLVLSMYAIYMIVIFINEK